MLQSARRTLVKVALKLSYVCCSSLIGLLTGRSISTKFKKFQIENFNLIFLFRLSDWTLSFDTSSTVDQR